MERNSKMILWIVLFALFMGITYFAYGYLTKDYQQSDNGTENKIEDEITQNKEQSSASKAPDFTVYDEQGKEVKLSDFSGKPVVLNFWASWCPPCKSEMGYFNQVYGEMKEEVVFMMVDLVDGKRETQEKALQYVAEQGYNLPVYFDTTMDAASIYSVSGIPTTFFIDGDGNLVHSHTGPLDAEALMENIGFIK